jgi:hypothetical protein
VVTRAMVREAKARFNAMRTSLEEQSDRHDIVKFNEINQIETEALYELFELRKTLLAMVTDTPEAQAEVDTTLARMTGFHLGVMAARLEAAEREEIKMD